MTPLLARDEWDLHYRVDGEGPRTLVLVNGLADDLKTWGGQMDAPVGAGYRVVRFDNRGIGKSGAPAELSHKRKVGVVSAVMSIS